MGKILIVNTGPVKSGLGKEISPDAVAQAVAERLLEYKVSAVYACQVPAADEMAQIIAGRFELKAQPLPGLGETQHVHWKELVRKESLMTSDSNVATPCGAGTALPPDSGIDELMQAVAVALDDIALKHKKEAAVIVSQQALSVIMMLHLLHLDSRHYGQIAQDAGAVNLFEFRFGMPSALYINDTCHLNSIKM